jgi:tRNA(Ile)-lysidine synthase
MKQTERYHEPVSQSFLQFVKKRGLIRTGQHVIAAVSGGIDSMVLLDLLAKHKDQLKISISVAHVNHMLRGKESKGDEKLVVQAANAYGFPFFVKEVQTKKLAAQEKISIQEAARKLRYEFFDNLKSSLGAQVIATAHTTDDNAETMLFHFFRGSGIEGMSGIPVMRGHYVRPLLSTTRKEIVQYAKSNKIKFREDSSNKKENYTRNFIRHTIIPQIERRINPGLTQTLLKESEIFSLLSEFVNKEVDRRYPAVVQETSIVLKALLEADLYLRHMIVKKLLLQVHIEPSFSIIDAVLDLMNRQKGSAADIQKEWIAERTADHIVLRERSEPGGFSHLISSPSSVTNDRFTFSIRRVRNGKNKRSNDPSIEYVDGDKITFPLTVRSWSAGDAFVPLGMKGKKKISDLFGEKKMTSEQKSSTPVVVSGGAIVWVAGVRLDDRFKITGTTKSIYQLSIIRHGKKNDHRQ